MSYSWSEDDAAINVVYVATVLALANVATQVLLGVAHTKSGELRRKAIAISLETLIL